MCVDCVGLLVGVTRVLGLPSPTEKEMPWYSELPHDNLTKKMGDKLMIPVAEADWSACLPGRAGLFWYRERNHGQHFAIFGSHPQTGSLSMIHAYVNVGKVVETGVNNFWRKRLMNVYEFKGASA